MHSRIHDYIKANIYFRDDDKPILQCNGNYHDFVFYPSQSIDLPTKGVYSYCPLQYEFEVEYVIISLTDNIVTYKFTVL